MMNAIGPRTEPCGTPGVQIVQYPLSIVLCLLYDNQSDIHASRHLSIP